MTNKRLERERLTIQNMIAIYCREKHHSQNILCENCQELFGYALQRIEKCPYNIEKPTCAQCPIHCYKLEKRNEIRMVMRYAGPRMVLYHPILTLEHYIDEYKNKMQTSKKRRNFGNGI